MAGYQKSTSRIKNEEGDTKKSFETVVPVQGAMLLLRKK
jgi:hypothetical protein